MHRSRTPPVVVVALLIAVLAASVAGGWFIAARAAGDRSPEARAQADPAEPPYDAGDPGDGPPAPLAPAVDPPAGASAPDAVPAEPVTTAPVTAPDPEPMPEPTPSPAPTPTPTPPPDTPTAPQPRPTPTPEPRPSPAPEPRPSPAPEPRPAPAPQPSPAPGPSIAPYEPPPAIGIAAEALPPEGRAWAMISSARRSAPAGSQERADLDWLVSFARSAAAPGRPEGRRATARRALRVNAWWFGRRGSPAERVIARDPDGVILTYKRGHGFMVNPVATMGRWRGLNEVWSVSQLADSVLPMLTERTHDGREWAALEYFDVPGDRSSVRPGVSGMGQARAVNLFAKAWAQTRDPRYLRAAERVMRSFTVPVDDGGVLASVPDPAGGAAGTWFPERAYPGRPAWTGAALNGFMVTIIELRRAAAALADTAAPATRTGPASVATTGTAPSADPATDSTPDSPTDPETDPAAAADEARGLADRATRSLVRFLPLHDSGAWSYYGLLTPGKPWRSYLADLNYHCYHVSLLRTLDGLYPAEGLGATATRWQKYVDARGASCPAR